MPELNWIQAVLASVASALLVKAILASITHFRNRGLRRRLLDFLVSVLNLKQYFDEWEATRRALGPAFAMTLPALLGNSEIRKLPGFITDPASYSINSGFFVGLNLKTLQKVFQEIQDPQVEYLAHGIVDALTLLVVIYRRKQLTLREMKLNASHREQANIIVNKLHDSTEQVRAHLDNLLNTYASYTQNATWTQELRMHEYDMSDFSDRLQSFQQLFADNLPQLDTADPGSIPCRDYE